jgi:hypothetical protein
LTCAGGGFVLPSHQGWHLASVDRSIDRWFSPTCCFFRLEHTVLCWSSSLLLAPGGGCRRWCPSFSRSESLNENTYQLHYRKLALPPTNGTDISDQAPSWSRVLLKTFCSSSKTYID